MNHCHEETKSTSKSQLPTKQEPSRSYKKARIVSQQQSSKIVTPDDVAMWFKAREDIHDCRMIKASCTDTNGNVCLPMFTDSVPKELLILLFFRESLHSKGQAFWVVWSAMSKLNLYLFQCFERASKGMPQKKRTDNKLSSQLDECGLPRQGTAFHLGGGGNHVFEEQCKHLCCKTKKPHRMKAADWISGSKHQQQNTLLNNKKRQES